jgi:hypothetical protein
MNAMDVARQGAGCRCTNQQFGRARSENKFGQTTCRSCRPIARSHIALVLGACRGRVVSIRAGIVGKTTLCLQVVAQVQGGWRRGLYRWRMLDPVYAGKLGVRSATC